MGELCMHSFSSLSRRISVAGACAALYFNAVPSHAQTPSGDGLQVTVGGAAMSVPIYPGSDEHETRFAPFIDVRLGRWFVGPVPAAPSPLGIGVDIVRNQGVRFGAALTSDLREIRREEDAPRLAGLGDVDGTQRANLYAAWFVDRYVLRANVAADVGGQDLGTLVTLEADAVFRPLPDWTLAVGPGLVWADGDYTQSVFGIDVRQSARSGLRAYSAESGVVSARVAALLNYRIDQHWNLGGRVAFARLQGDAVDSPIVERRSQPSAAVFASYRF